jgi:hypothetical protein
VHDLVNPSGVEKSLVADKKYLVPPKASGARADLGQQPSAEDDLRHFEFAVMKIARNIIHLCLSTILT